MKLTILALMAGAATAFTSSNTVRIKKVKRVRVDGNRLVMVLFS
jgi:hypothetical protein